MYTKTFEADTLDEALKSVKMELGPDAIILKTITNKGLKGAINKKKKIEVTAAIPERSYEKKARVDRVLNPNQKEQFYKAPADYIAESIDSFNSNEQISSGYGKLGINKVVQQTKNKIISGLDDFLASDSYDDSYEEAEELVTRPAPKAQVKKVSTPAPRYNLADEVISTPVAPTQVVQTQPAPVLPSMSERELKRDVQLQHQKLEMLQEKINELSSQLADKNNNVPAGLKDLRNILKTMEVSEKFISTLIKKASFELNSNDLENADKVLDFALREISSNISVEMPLYSKVNKGTTPVITLLISEAACGQTSMAMKMAAMVKDSTLIQFSGQDISSVDSSLASKLYKINLVKVNTLTELITECRKNMEQNRSVFIDFRNQNVIADETKKFIEGMRRAFSHLEILVTVSAIHTELYNQKLVNKYRELAHGVVISHLDLCLNYGQLLNVHLASKNQDRKVNVSNAAVTKGLPLVFFGTGPTVPNDIEAATAERIIAGMFEL